MDRLETAANIIRDEAKRILQAKITGPAITRKPGRRYMIVNGRRVQSENAPVWMEREPGALLGTIRTVRKHGSSARNIWVMAGNYKYWWALQAEYGRGGWKGGPKAFLRPALKRAPSLIQGVLENGR